jgi:hypothetical protein
MDFIVFKCGLCYHLTNDTTLNYQFNIIEWTCVNYDFSHKVSNLIVHWFNQIGSQIKLYSYKIIFP